MPCDALHGTVDINYQKSKVLEGQTGEFRVYTPPDYDQNPTGRYPVTFLRYAATICQPAGSTLAGKTPPSSAYPWAGAIAKYWFDLERRGHYPTPSWRPTAATLAQLDEVPDRRSAAAVPQSAIIGSWIP